VAEGGGGGRERI